MAQEQVQPVLPDPKTAQDTLFTEIQADAFFGQLARRGFTPANEKQAQDFVELAGKLQMLQQAPQIKQAQAANDPIHEASAALDNVMGQYGFNVKAASEKQAEVGIRNVAAQLAQNPRYYNAVISVKAAEAQALMAQQA